MPPSIPPKPCKKRGNVLKTVFQLARRHRDKTQGRDDWNPASIDTCQDEKQTRAHATSDVNHDDPAENQNGRRTRTFIRSENSRSKTKTWPFPLRAAPAQEQLNNEAQQHQSPFDPASTKLRLSKTWDTIRSAGGASIHTVASGLRKLVCIESDLESREKRNPRLSRSKTGLPFSRGRLRRKSNPGREPDIDETSPAGRAGTFPIMNTNTQSPGIADFKQRLRERAETSAAFNGIWEATALPHLRNVLSSNRIDEYSITVQFDYDYSQRVVEVTSPKNKQLPDKVRPDVKGKIESMFRPTALLVEIQFVEGVTVRSGRQDANSDEDQSAAPGNVYDATARESLPERSGHSTNDNTHQDEEIWDLPDNPDDWLAAEALAESTEHAGALLLGDSIGPERGVGAATLGPAIHFGEQIAWLVSGHVFEDEEQLGRDHGLQLPECHIVHPGNMDCGDEKKPRRVARLCGYSGRMCQTQRQSRSIKHFAPRIPLHDRWVVTDWAVCVPEEDAPQLLNRLRYAPKGREFQNCSGLVKGPGQKDPQLLFVRSSGRSSGIRWSVVCETPALVKQKGQPPTREWFLEYHPELMKPMLMDQWNSGGPGVPGDSGAVIIDDETREIVGIIWGRTDHDAKAQGARCAYFTHIFDVFDDIYERYPEISGYPRLEGQEVGPMALRDPPSNSSRNYDPRDYADEDGDGTVPSSAPRRSGHLGVTRYASHESMTLTACGSSDAGNSILGRHDSGCVHVVTEKTVEFTEMMRPVSAQR